MRDKYSVIKSRYITEKSSTLEGLQFSKSNKCSEKCTTPKYVFLVDVKATKVEIAKAVEEIYSAKKKISVKKVNTVTVRPRRKRFRGRYGRIAGYKKAIVSLAPGDSIEDAV